jgi:hypothetical protein
MPLKPGINPILITKRMISCSFCGRSSKPVASVGLVLISGYVLGTQERQVRDGKS